MTANARMITLARESEGLTQSALAHAIGISQALLSKIEHGLDEANDSVLRAAARECKVPVEFFMQPEEPLGEGIVDFFHRKRLTLPAKPLKKAHAVGNVTRLEVLRLLRGLDLTEVAPFPTFPSSKYPSPAETAAMVRAMWRIPPGPLPNLVALIEAAGSPVVLTDLGHEKLSAISMPAFEGCHVILLNASLPASHQRWSLAHELGHLVMHVGVPSEDMEHDADAFASALLMPADDIRPQLRNLRFRDLGALKPLWQVSLAALIRTAHDLGETSDRQYRWFNMQLNKLPEGRKREPGEFAREEPRLLRHVIDHYTKDLGYTSSDIAKLMVTTEESFGTRYLGQTARTLRTVGRGNLHSLPVPGAS